MSSRVLICTLFGIALVSTVGAPTAFGGSAIGVKYDATHIVVLEPGADLAAVASRHGLDVTVVYSSIFNGFAGVVPDERLAALERDPRVAVVEPNMSYQLLDQVVPTGVQRIYADLNPDARIDGADERVAVVVGVLDGGVQGDHPDLNVNVDKSVDCTNKGPCSIGVARDLNGHGTHVAGTVGALDNGIGVVGVAPGAEIWSIRVCTSRCVLDNILKGHDYVSANARSIPVINVSLGGLGWNESWRMAIKDNVDKGVVVVVAAGNENADIYGGDGTIGDGNETSPAAFPEAIAVSALVDSDGREGGNGPDTKFGVDDTLASFSSFSRAVVADNPVSSPGAAIDWAAPGVNILSTSNGSSYATMSGTSMAAPHGAGAVALYIAANGRASDAAGVAALRQAIIDGCQVRGGWRLGQVALDSDPDANHEGLVNVAPPALEHEVAVTAIRVPTPAVRGTPATVDVVLRNNGAAGETFDAVLHDLTDGLTIGSELVTLAPGTSQTVDFSWDTSDATPGEHRLEAEALLETDEDTSNNRMTTRVSVQSPIMDVALTTLSAPTSALRGEVMRVDVTVANVGNQGVAADILVTLADATDVVIIGRQTVAGGLSAGASATLTFRWDTAAATPGHHALTATHHLLDDVGTNNSLTSTVVVNEPGPALHVAVITDDKALKDGDKARITGTVTAGHGPVDGAIVHLDVTTGNGSHRALDGSTDGQGEARFRMRVDSTADGCGRYAVGATASRDGFAPTGGSAAFEVLCEPD